MKKRIIILFTLIPFVLGYLTAYFQGKPVHQALSFVTNNILSTDTIILSSNGDIYKLNQNTTTQLTQNQNLIEPVLAGNDIIAIEKTTNYSSLVMYDQTGKKLKTLFNGNSGNIDTMSWITDPSVSLSQHMLAYVSDKDKNQTQMPDNALYVMNLINGKSTNIANPASYSGGLAHPVFDPSDENIILYDYYQYDAQTLTPYSTIEEYNKQTGVITTLTFENKNAYQEAFSPDGRQILFLGRNNSLNTVTMYIANFASDKLSNIHALVVGDFAYPSFSYTNNHIYYLQAEGNKGYNLLTATVQNNKLMNAIPIVNGFQLLGNSSYMVVNNKNTALQR